MWGLTYDYLTGYSMTDMSPQPALATKWTTSPDGKTWTFTVRSGVKFSDGVPLTAADVAYTYNRVLHGTVEQSSWISYLQGVTKVTAPNATTVVMKLKKPSATLPLLPIPIVPEHVWKNVSEKEVKTYSAAPSNGKPVVGSGPFRLVQGQGDGSTFKFEKNPNYWGGTPHIDEVLFQVYKNDDSAVQALIKGEVDFVEDITALEVKSLQGKAGITAHNGNSPGFDEIAFNSGSVDGKGNPIGNPNPAVLDPKFRHALGYALDLPTLIKKVYQGAGLPGDDDHPAGVQGVPLGAAGGPEVHLRPGQGGAAARRRRLHEGLRRHPHPAGRQVDGHAAAGGALGLPDVAAHHGLLQAVALRPGHQVAGLDLQLEPADRRDPQGQLRRLPVGLVRRARPGLDAQLPDDLAVRRLVGLVVLQQAVRPAVQASSTPRPTTPSGWPTSRRCRRSSTATRPTW